MKTYLFPTQKQTLDAHTKVAFFVVPGLDSSHMSRLERKVVRIRDGIYVSALGLTYTAADILFTAVRHILPESKLVTTAG